MSRSRNARLNVTGTLLASKTYFAQILEGPAPKISELMESIRRDPRHMDIQVFLYEDIRKQRFASWSLAYAGKANFIDGLIRPLAERHGQTIDAHHTHNLLVAMREFNKKSS